MSFQKYKYEFDIESSDDMGSVELYEMEMSYQLYAKYPKFLDALKNIYRCYLE